MPVRAPFMLGKAGGSRTRSNCELFVRYVGHLVAREVLTA